MEDTCCRLTPARLLLKLRAHQLGHPPFLNVQVLVVICDVKEQTVGENGPILVKLDSNGKSVSSRAKSESESPCLRWKLHVSCNVEVSRMLETGSETTSLKAEHKDVYVALLTVLGRRGYGRPHWRTGRGCAG